MLSTLFDKSLIDITNIYFSRSHLLQEATMLCPGADHEGADHEGADHEGANHEGADHEGADHEGADHEGADQERLIRPLWIGQFLK